MEQVLVPAVILVMVLLTLFYAFKSKVYRLLGVVLKAGFLFSMILALAGLFLPQPFEAVAGFTLEQTGILTQIQSVDHATDPDNIIKTITDLLPSWLDPQPKAEVEKVPGPIETGLYPGLVSLVSGIYRVFGIIMALAGMVLVIYFDTTTEAYRKIQSLESRLKKLEAQQAPK